METEYKTCIDKLSEQISKIYNYFLHIEDLLNFEKFFRAVDFGTEMVRKLFNREEKD